MTGKGKAKEDFEVRRYEPSAGYIFNCHESCSLHSSNLSDSDGFPHCHYSQHCHQCQALFIAQFCTVSDRKKELQVRQKK